MSEPIKIDPRPLIEQLLAKSLDGKLQWEPTADTKTFVTSVGGEATFRVRLAEGETIAPDGRTMAIVDVPRLDILDAQGHLLWDIGDVKGGPLSRLYEVARASADRSEERPGGSRRPPQGPRTEGPEEFLKRLRRYPAERALMRVGEGRKARDFWDLVEYVVNNR